MKQAPVEAPVALNDTERRVVVFCQEGPKGKDEILRHLGYTSMSGNLKRALQHLTELGLLGYTIPGKPNSRNQKRRLTVKGLSVGRSFRRSKA
jgi:hypothetical protein